MGNKRRGERHQSKEAASPPANGDGDGTIRQEIQLRAYYRYCERGCEPGGEIEDWLSAEQEVFAQHRGA